MEKALEQIDALASVFNAVENKDMTPELALAKERLGTVRRRVELHFVEVKKRAEAVSKAIAEKEAELKALKGDQATAAPATK
jgi:hypothetical protein